MLDFSRLWPGNTNIHFIHNWRCAGTTLNSLFSSNFHASYAKIGHPFTNFGWPQNYKSHRAPLLTVDQCREIQRINASHKIILGGHTFNGLESFLPGSWDIWMNFRDPLSRLNSGILRFYSSKISSQSTNPGKHLIHHNLKSGALNLDSPSAIDNLLSTALLRESNGMARRLSALSICNGFSLAGSDNVEVNPIICENSYSDRDLFDASLSNISGITHFFNSQHISASLISLERKYNLSPLINPFSDLRHNRKELGGSKKSSQHLIENCKSVLLKHSNVDRQLMPFLNQKFAEQVNESKIDSVELEIRKLIHDKPLFDVTWFDELGEPRSDRVLHLMASSLFKRCRQAGELSHKLFETITNSPILKVETQEQLQRIRVNNPSLMP